MYSGSIRPVKRRHRLRAELPLPDLQSAGDPGLPHARPRWSLTLVSGCAGASAACRQFGTPARRARAAYVLSRLRSPSRARRRSARCLR